MQRWVKKYKGTFAVISLFVLLTIVISRPVWLELDTVLIGSDADVMINPWADWWTWKAWTTPELSLYRTDYMFYPHGANLIFHSFSHLNTVVSLALQPLLGVIPAYNVSMLLNIFLAGLAMYHLAHYLTGSMKAGIIAGIIFAYNSYSLYQTGHPVLVSTWTLPWATVYLWRAVQENSRKWAVVASLFVFLAAAASTLLLILSGIWFAILISYWFISRSEPRPTWGVLFTFGLSSGSLALPLLLPLLQDAIIQDNSTFLVNPQRFLVADIFAPLLPHWYLWMRQNIYLGIAPLYLAMLAVGSRRKEIGVWLLLVMTAYLFSIGPRPQILTEEIDVVLPWTVLVTKILREPHRWNILFGLGLAMLGAYGWLAMERQLSGERKQRLAAAFVILAIFGEYTAGSFPVTQPQVSPFYTEILAQEPPEVAIAILPTGRQQDKKYMYYQTLHGHKMTGGVISRASEATFAFIYNNPLLRAGAVDLPPEPIPEDVRPHLQALAENNIAYLILDKTMMDVEPWRAAFPFPPVYEDDLLLVYETEPE